MKPADSQAGGRRLLFVSNLFPDRAEPYRGLDNATVLHHLTDRWDIRAIALRPTLPWRRRDYSARHDDERFEPAYRHVPYVPKIGSRVNHLLVEAWLRSQLIQLRKRFAFDVVLSSWIYPDSCAVARLSRTLGFPFVAIAQGSDVHHYLQIPARRTVIRECMPSASAIITRSRDLAHRLQTADIPPDRLHPIYNGVDRTVFRPASRGEARQELGIDNEAKVVLFVGNFYPVKQPLTLIEGFAKLVQRHGYTTAQLLLVGGGPMEAEVRLCAERLGISSRVAFAGRHDAQGVALRMQAADVLCLPSANEGVPNVILEAFSCGLPVVASDVGGIPEVLDRPALGRRVPPGDSDALAVALNEVVTTPPGREEILSHSGQFTWNRAADAYHRLLLTAAPQPEGR